MSDLKLTTQPSAAVEKRLAAHKKKIELYDKSVSKAGAELFGYAYLLGRELNLTAEALTDQGFAPWLAENFPDMHRSKAYRYREFATAMEPKIIAHVSQSESDSVKNKQCITVGQLSKVKKLPAKILPAILAAVPEVMDGKGMLEFMRGEKLLKETKPDGGFRPNAEMLAEWIAANCPEQKGKSYDDLTPAQQKAFRKQYNPNPAETPEEKAAQTRQTWDHHINELAQQLTDETHVAFGPEQIADLEPLVAALHDLHKRLAGYLAKLKKSEA